MCDEEYPIYTDSNRVNNGIKKSVLTDDGEWEWSNMMTGYAMQSIGNGIARTHTYNYCRWQFKKSLETCLKKRTYAKNTIKRTLITYDSVSFSIWMKPIVDKSLTHNSQMCTRHTSDWRVCERDDAYKEIEKTLFDRLFQYFSYRHGNVHSIMLNDLFMSQFLCVQTRGIRRICHHLFSCHGAPSWCGLIISCIVS